jgi:hypothetical protein
MHHVVQEKRTHLANNKRGVAVLPLCKLSICQPFRIPNFHRFRIRKNISTELNRLIALKCIGIVKSKAAGEMKLHFKDRFF